jgi:competence protein ComFC
MLQLIRKAADAALDLAYPRGVSCALCGADLEQPGGVLCEACEAKMPRVVGPACPGCGRSIERKGFCRMCREFGPAADRGFASFNYEGKARDLLIDFKFNDKTGYRELFAHYMLETLDEAIKTGEACVVPVPMHWRREFTRGYNQSALLASWIAQELGVPLIKGVLARPVYTKAVSRMPGGPKERMESALKSYRRGKGSLVGKTVLLVDDILTSGATVRACAAILRNMGAEKVYSVVAAAVPE